MIVLVKIILFYLIGCILAYGRSYASFYIIDEKFIDSLPPKSTDDNFNIAISLFSWVSFITGIFIYFMDNEKYFLKYTNKDLWERYNNRK